MRQRCARVAVGGAILAVALWGARAPAQPADSAVPTEPLLDGGAATPVAAEPPATHRPTRPATATIEPPLTATTSASATATAGDTATAAPSATTTRPKPPTGTATIAPTVAVTPSPTPGALAAVLGGRMAGHAPWLVLGSLLTLCGVWLGARVAGARERSARRRARVTLASAMLLELRRLDAVLRRMVALDNPASFPSLDHPIMEAALRDLTLFAARTAARIAQFHGALRGIQHEVADYRDNPLRWAGRLGELNQLIKGRAAAACRAVPELMKALEKEGGAPPPSLGEPAQTRSSSDASGLPPPPFGAGEGDDWTM